MSPPTVLVESYYSVDSCVNNYARARVLVCACDKIYTFIIALISKICIFFEKKLQKGLHIIYILRYFVPTNT